MKHRLSFAVAPSKVLSKFLTRILHRNKYTYWYLTTDPETLPVNSTSYVMTNIDKIKYQDVGNIYGERTWIEYGFRQSKSELGWSDFHVTKYNDIAK